MTSNNNNNDGLSNKNRGLLLWIPQHFDKDFQSRFFANRIVDNLIDAGLGLNDFFYDLKERLLDNPLRCSSRMRAVEQCQAAIVFLLWPIADGSGSPREQQPLLSVTELAELSVLCVRSMSPKAETVASGKPSTSSLVKLYIVCHQEPMYASPLPSSLSYALSGSGRYPVVRLPWSPSDSGITTSQLREMAGNVCCELIAFGVSEWCRAAAVLASRAAWLTAISASAMQQGPVSLEVKLPGIVSKEKEMEEDYNNEQKRNEPWKKHSSLDWTPSMVQDFLMDIKVPGVIAMRMDELALDGSELSIMDTADFTTHALVDNVELCKILRKKVQQQLGPHSLKELAYNAGKRKLARVYLVFDPRDAKIANQLHRNLNQLHFEVFQHGQLGRSRTEFALTQLQVLVQCAYFVVLLTETSLASPFVWEEVCLIRSVIQPPASAVIALSWNIGSSFYPTEMYYEINPGLKQIVERNNAGEDVLPISSLILLLADVQNIPLLVQTDVSASLAKISRLIETAIRAPPPGVVLATPSTNEFADILAPNSADCESLVFQPHLSSLGAHHKQSNHYGYLVSNFLPRYDADSQLFDQRLQLLTSIYIAPPLDIAIICDWMDGRTVAEPLLTAFRTVGLRCFADFENPLLTAQKAVKSAIPKARLRLLLLTTSTGHLPSSHPLMSTAILDSTMSPLLFVLCSRSPIASADEVPASKSPGSGIIPAANISSSQQYQQQLHRGDDYYSPADSAVNASMGEGSSYPTALLLDMSSARGIARFVNAVCHYLGHHTGSEVVNKW